MTNNVDLLPVLDIKKSLMGEGGEIIIPRYRTGEPRHYRLDLGKGILNLDGRIGLTSPGSGFSVTPIAVRCLEDGIFGQEVKKWFEVYFLNRKGHVCVFMFHGYSVENLSVAARELFYEECTLCQVRWNITLQEKMNKDGKKYYMAFFTFEPLTDDELTILEVARNNVLDTEYHIYRSGTAYNKTLFSEHWSDGKTPTEKELADEAARQKALLREFATPEELAKMKEEEEATKAVPAPSNAAPKKRATKNKAA